MKRKSIFFAVVMVFLSSGAFATNYVVTNTNDSGNGSLRAALTSISNSYSGNHNISFNIPISDAGYDTATGTFTINILSELPYILVGNNICIDATTQTTNVGNTNPFGPEIVLDGGSRNLMSCFRVASNNCTIKGFAIGGFQYAILFYGANGGCVSDCYIGIKATGDSAFTNPNTYGIGLSGGTYSNYNFGYTKNVTIRDNVISGNTTAGIALVTVHNNTIVHNKIGTNYLGTTSVPNNQGIYLTTASYSNTIGGNADSLRNILSGNTNAAVVLDGSGTSNNIISGNYIGVDASGDTALGNHYGVIIMTNANKNRIGGTSIGERNIISANSEIGIYIESADSNKVCGNYIGLNKDGTRNFVDARDTALQANGVEINSTGKHNLIGGSTSAERNVISGNKVYGCIYYGNCSKNNIAGNYIGTDYTGTVAIPNATGICVDGSSNNNIMENNVLSGNKSYGLFIVTRGTDSNIFRGNYVGVDASGLVALPNDVGLMLAADAKANIIGGETVSERNIFSGNQYAGIEVTDSGTENNKILGNFIGVDKSGNAPLPNENGIIVSALVRRLTISKNVISSNSGFGLVITDRADSIMVYNNKIGVGFDGTTALGNASSGIFIGNGANNNFIGGDGKGNTIANNDSLGIVLMDANTINNRISQNSIYDNQYMGIDLYPWGINENDTADIDDGCNHLMNYPVIESVVFDIPTAYTLVRGFLDTPNPQNAKVELFVANQGASAPREGKKYLTTTTPYSDGTIWIRIRDISPNEVIIATATDENGNTSEFSAPCIATAGIKECTTSDILPLPNPTYGYFVLNNIEGNLSIEIYNALGQRIKTATEIIQNNSSVSIDISGQKAGTYFVILREKDKVLRSIKIQKL